DPKGHGPATWPGSPAIAARPPLPAEPAAPGARPLLDQRGQARALLLVEDVVDLGHEPDERLADGLERTIVTGVELAQHHLVEAGLAQDAGQLLARALALAVDGAHGLGS